MKTILNLILKLIGLISTNKKNRQIQEDIDVAKDIRKGNGRKIAEEWKRRKKYR